MEPNKNSEKVVGSIPMPTWPVPYNPQYQYYPGPNVTTTSILPSNPNVLTISKDYINGVQDALEDSGLSGDNLKQNVIDVVGIYIMEKFDESNRTRAASD